MCDSNCTIKKVSLLYLRNCVNSIDGWGGEGRLFKEGVNGAGLRYFRGCTTIIWGGGGGGKLRPSPIYSNLHVDTTLISEVHPT